MFAGADIVTLVGCGTSHPHAVIDARTDSIGAGVPYGIGISVIAARPICLLWIGTRARSVVAGANIMALVGYGTNHPHTVIDARTNPIGAGVPHGADISVIAARPICLDWT